MKWVGEAAGHHWDYLPHNACARSVQVRTYEDVVGPLATLCFTGVLAYLHLLWTRGEPILDWRPFFFPFSPLTIVFQHGFALIAIFSRFIISRIRPEEEQFDVRIPLRHLLGRVPPAPETAPEPSLAEKEDESNSVSSGPHNDGFGNLLGPAKALGLTIQFAGLIIYLVYCILNIKFFIRRHSHSSNSLVNADYTILQLSVAGILIVLLTLPHTPLTPFSLFTSPVPTPSRSYRRANSRFHQAIVFFRDSAAPSLFPSRYSPALFRYLQQFRQIFYLEAISALLIATNFGTSPPVPLSAIIANYDSYGAIPLPTLREDYYWREGGGRVIFALLMLHAVRSNVQKKKFWEKEVLEAHEALAEEISAGASTSSNDKRNEDTSGALPTASSPPGEAHAEHRDTWARIKTVVAAFLNDPLAYSPSVSTMLPFVVAFGCVMNVWDRLLPELADWEKWPADVPCPNQWWDPSVGKWERFRLWWTAGMDRF
ncbi:hypothetical protein MPH_01908 [Macrophomina phaseolina MS6]|uniref:Uncharacterized protein n=1 Tax=Macrophomina phaseolina (strain MS6) TaxID=1126212 RepID=K2RDX9_MACPH|nr:hypothetical protein MPH_01908 [Macrophomina phaseolina MS6]